MTLELLLLIGAVTFGWCLRELEERRRRRDRFARALDAAYRKSGGRS